MSQVTSPLTVASPGCFPAAGAVVCELALVGVPLRDPRQLLVPDLNTEQIIMFSGEIITELHP